MRLIAINDPSGKRIYINPAQITLMQRAGVKGDDLEIVLGTRTLTMPGDGSDLDRFSDIVYRALNDIPEPQAD